MTPSHDKSLNLNLFIYPDGHHEAAWRHPDSQTDRILDISYYQELAQKAEAAKFDAVFFADGPSLAENIQYAARFRLEPITVMTAIVAATERIGVIGTASTTYTEPYNLARQFAALDHLSNGRAGWNIVTTGAANAALNFGLDAHPLHRDRYARAEEYVEVITKLWDSWEDDAVVADRETGVFADPDKIHTIDHVGKCFRVKGPLNAPRSPQGRPVYVQAGSSEDGRAFAARWAEAIFTAHQTLGSAQEFYADIKRRAQAVGRDPRGLKVLPGISPFIGSTAQEAEDLHQQFNDLTQPVPAGARHRRARAADPAPAVPPARRRARAPGRHRHPRPGRRHHPGLGRARRRRRLQRDAAVAPGRDRGLHRGGRSDPARPRPVPHRVHRKDAPRPPRSRAPREPVRTQDPGEDRMNERSEFIIQHSATCASCAHGAKRVRV
ncbi:NtaA/DmoA family FMN-dependent monooxygenase [Nocardioides zhouii]|uniref:NtaA/DmoA family FMN-dependent monooxygenase n=1 Tax=Nocardioides zhouii TaxID=1168729 RepID=UPI001F5DB462|nr:NtaA/DmoA family FMN-dependent monooxygenase [Nocardioides zhouii]